MDRLFVGFVLCTCLCLTPLGCAREYGRREETPSHNARAFFSVLYPEWAGMGEGAEGEDVEWYSAFLAFLRGEAA